MGLDDKDHTTYAKGLAAALRVLGPTRREHVIGMLRGLQLSEKEANDVLAFALSRHLLEEDEDVVSAPRGTAAE